MRQGSCGYKYCFLKEGSKNQNIIGWLLVRIGIKKTPHFFHQISCLINIQSIIVSLYYSSSLPMRHTHSHRRKTFSTEPTAPSIIAAAVLAVALPELVDVPRIFTPADQNAIISPANAV
jgi:hypothetical protein